MAVDSHSDQRDICFGHLSRASAHFSKKFHSCVRSEPSRKPAWRRWLRRRRQRRQSSSLISIFSCGLLARACLCCAGCGLPAVQSMPIIQAKGGMNPRSRRAVRPSGHGRAHRGNCQLDIIRQLLLPTPPPPPIVYEQRRGVSLCQTRSTAHRNSAFRPKLRDIEAKCNLKHPKFINARRSESPCPTTWLPTRLTSAGEECAACDLKCMLVSAGGKRIAHIFHRHRACAQRLLVVRNARVRLQELPERQRN